MARSSGSWRTATRTTRRCSRSGRADGACAACPRRRSSPSSRQEQLLVVDRRRRASRPTGGANLSLRLRWSARVLWRVLVVGLGLVAALVGRGCCSWAAVPGARDRPWSRARAGRAVARRRGWYGQCRGSRTAVPRAPLRPGCRRPARVARRAAVRRHRPGAARRAPRTKPVQRRPPDAARLRGGGGREPRGVARAGRARCATPSRRAGGSRRSTSARTASRGGARASSRRSGSSRTRTASSCPHERTHAGPKEGRLRLLRATRTQLEPLFFLWDGTVEVDGLGEPELTADEGGVVSRLWRLDAGVLRRARSRSSPTPSS